MVRNCTIPRHFVRVSDKKVYFYGDGRAVVEAERSSVAPRCFFFGCWNAALALSLNTLMLNTECPKKMYTHKVNIPYYKVYTSFWHTLYRKRSLRSRVAVRRTLKISYNVQSMSLQVVKESCSIKVR
jgi:hypothetical protein